MVKINGSKDGTVIAARFKGKSKSLFPTLKQTKVLVLLSMRGNPYCTGVYLKAIIEKACAEHEHATFLIADELYWNNLVTNPLEDESAMLKEQAISMGRSYFEEHLECFLRPLNMSMNEFDAALIEQFPLDKQLTLNKIASQKSNFEVLFWRDWLNKSPEFNDKKNAIMALYKTEDSLRKSIEYAAADFARRHQNNECSEELLLQRSKNYLLEESPAVMWLAAFLGYHFIAYAGELIKPFDETKKYFIKNADCLENNDLFIKTDKAHLLVNWLEVGFHRSHENASSNKKEDFGSSGIISMKSDERCRELTAMLKGVTEGIFALDLDNESKINLIVNVINQCQSKNKAHYSELIVGGMSDNRHSWR